MVTATQTRGKQQVEQVRRASVHNDRKPMRCQHCGGRLFLEVDTTYQQKSAYLNCVNCARPHDLFGREIVAVRLG